MAEDDSAAPTSGASGTPSTPAASPASSPGGKSPEECPRVAGPGSGSGAGGGAGVGADSPAGAAARPVSPPPASPRRPGSASDSKDGAAPRLWCLTDDILVDDWFVSPAGSPARTAVGPDCDEPAPIRVCEPASPRKSPPPPSKEQLKAQRRRESRIVYQTRKLEPVLAQWRMQPGNVPKGLAPICRQGLPPRYRGEVWCRLVRDKLHITSELYTIFKAHARKAVDEVVERRRVQEEEWKRREAAGGDPSIAGGVIEPEGSDDSLLKGKEKTILGINIDIPRTFPGLAFFTKEDGPLHQPLRHVLEAYAFYRPDAGYVQGMSHVAAVLLLSMDEEKAFRCFANLMASQPLRAIVSRDRDTIHRWYDAFTECFKARMPKLEASFRHHGIRPSFHLLPWLLTLFSRTLPLDTACCVWDVFLLEGQRHLACTALGILKVLEPRLLPLEFEEVHKLLISLPEDLEHDVLLASINSVKLSRKEHHLFDEFDDQGHSSRVA